MDFAVRPSIATIKTDGNLCGRQKGDTVSARRKGGFAPLPASGSNRLPFQPETAGRPIPGWKRAESVVGRTEPPLRQKVSPPMFAFSCLPAGRRKNRGRPK